MLSRVRPDAGETSRMLLCRKHDFSARPDAGGQPYHAPLASFSVRAQMWGRNDGRRGFDLVVFPVRPDAGVDKTAAPVRFMLFRAVPEAGGRSAAVGDAEGGRRGFPDGRFTRHRWYVKLLFLVVDVVFLSM